MSGDEQRHRGKLRAMKVALGHLNRADGSAIFQAGTTQVWAAVSGPKNAGSDFLEPDRIALDVRFCMNFDTQRNQVVDDFFERVLEQVIECDLHPHTALTVTAQVLQDDGGIIAAALNAISMALLDSAISCNSIMCAIQLSKTDDGRLHLDPRKKDEAGEFIVIVCRLNGEHGLTIITSMKFGTWGDELLKAAEDMARSAAMDIFGFFRETYQMSYRNDLFNSFSDLRLSDAS